MLAATTTATTSTHSQALKLLQISSSGKLNGPTREPDRGQTAAFLALPGGSKVNAAISAIINILLDAQGNSTVNIAAKDGFAYAQTGAGDDTIVMDVHHVGYISSGKGNDSISIRTHALSEAARATSPNRAYAAVTEISSGDGNDAIAIDSHGHITNVYGGDGNDAIAIATAAGHNDPDYYTMGGVRGIDGGSGDDTIAINASNGMVDVINGGTGDDTIDILGRYVTRVFGDEGDDTIRIAAEHAVNGVYGGNGNDTIEVTSPIIHTINGGKGDDRIILNNTANTYSHLTFEPGDGHDFVRANSAVAISRFVGTNKPFDMSKGSIDRIDEATLKITFDDSEDSVTIHFTGDIVGKPLAFDFYKSGALMIRRNDDDAPTLPAYGHAGNPVVLTHLA